LKNSKEGGVKLRMRRSILVIRKVVCLIPLCLPAEARGSPHHLHPDRLSASQVLAWADQQVPKEPFFIG
jgi:hypothetical protein